MAAGGPGSAYDLQIKVRATLAPRSYPGERDHEPGHQAMLLTAPGCLWQLMMIGDTTVGKTSLLVRYADDDFNESVLATIGIDFKIKVLLRHLWLCAAWPLPAARCEPAPPLARRLSTSMARRSSCRFGTLPARCVAPVHHHAALECPVPQPERWAQAVRRVADPGSATARQERFRTITQAYYRGAMGIFLIYVAVPFESGDGPAHTPPHTRAPAQPSEPPGAGCDEHQDVEQYSQLGPQHRGQRTTDREQNPHR